MTPFLHPRWERTVESTEFFDEEDKLKLVFHGLLAASALLLTALGLGLWRLRRAALAPPLVVGISGGWVFTGAPSAASTLRAGDFDRQFAETVEVLFTRTEKGAPPALGQFCAPEVIDGVARAYADAAARYPAGYVQTLTLLEAKPVEAKPGLRRVYFRGLLSSRSTAAAQISPVYFDCLFSLAGRSALNAAGWRLVRVDAIAREAFYRDEEETRERRDLRLPAPTRADGESSP